MLTRRLQTLFSLMLLLCFAAGPLHSQVIDLTQPEQSPVQVATIEFPLTNPPRPGSLVGCRLVVQSTGDQIRDVLVQLALPDPDGDETLYTAHVVMNPNQRREVWLYPFVPYNYPTEAEVRVYQAEETSSRSTGLDRFAPSKLLFSNTFRFPQQNVPPTSTTFIGVVGPALGLEHYEYRDLSAGMQTAPSANDPVRVVQRIALRDLPDRWMGYAPLETLVWTGSTAQTLPSQLAPSQAQAITEWVRRGGHLVVTIPGAGQVWLGTSSNPLADIMPDVTSRRDEDVDLQRFLSVLTNTTLENIPDRPLSAGSDARWYEDGTVTYFTPAPGTPTDDARPLMLDDNGDCFVVQRLVGTGAVTLIGINLEHRGLRALNLVETDVFWNRILGKRQDVISLLEYVTDSKRNKPIYKYGKNPPVTHLDNNIEQLIALRGGASKRLFFAFIIFVVYWGIAGPLSYLYLKSTARKHHAWLVFVGSIAVFTIIAWGGSPIFKPLNVTGRHLTFLDHVHGQSNQTVRSWMTLILPDYGNKQLSLASDDPFYDFHNVILPWKSGEGGLSFGSFPDARGYIVDSRQLDTLEVPSRATAKLFHTEWAGYTDLALPTPVIDPDAEPDQPAVRFVPRPETLVKKGERTWMLDGILTHDLPVPLEDVTIIVVESLELSDRYKVLLLNNPQNSQPPLFDDVIAKGAAINLANAWTPGDPLVLSDRTILGAAYHPSETLANFFKSIRTTSKEDRLTALSLYSMLPQPNVVDNRQRRYSRTTSSRTDLGRWFNQPCLIVTGVMRDAPTPLPLRVRGENPSSTRNRITGDTFVRWVYPLPPSPLVVQGPSIPESE